MRGSFEICHWRHVCSVAEAIMFSAWKQRIGGLRFNTSTDEPAEQTVDN